MTSTFKDGDKVVYRPHGIGRIVGEEMNGSVGALCFAVAFPSGMRAFIPVQTADTMLRPLSTREEAEAGLAILRSATIEPEKGMHREKREERARVLRAASLPEATILLRQLYGGKVPVSDSDGKAIRSTEDLVLEEISLVLGIPRTELEREMRERYPVFKEPKAQRGRDV